MSSTEAETTPAEVPEQPAAEEVKDSAKSEVKKSEKKAKKPPRMSMEGMLFNGTLGPRIANGNVMK